MTSEWLRVMLDEIARKKAEAEQDRLEFVRRQQERAAERPVATGDEGLPPARGHAEGLPPARGHAE